MYRHTVPAPSLTMQTLEDPFYYLANFQHVLSWISERYSDLLSLAEREFVAGFAAVPKASQALLVRMVMRKGTLFRAGKLVYEEIGPSLDAVQPLVANGWVEAVPEIGLDELFQLLTKPEIIAAFKAHIDRPGARKGEILESLRPAFPEPRCYEQWCPGSPERVLALSVMDMCDRFRLMFFGNLNQDWSEFVLADLGLYRYETVEFSLASRAFRVREDVNEYLRLYRCREAFEAYLAAGEADAHAMAEIIEAVAGPAGTNPWIEARRAKLLFQVAYHCERRESLATALELYESCGYAGARERRIRVLERMERFQAALDLAREAERAPETEAEKQQLLRILPRLQRKLGLAKPARPKAAPVERVDLRVPRPVTPCSVEQVAGRYLSEPESSVWYVENTLINSLFGLLCWEAIFAPLPGAFFHRFHSGPADLLRPDFSHRRRDLFEDCLAQLESGGYKARIRQTYAEKQGLQSPFVFWGGLTEELLEQALHCLPPEHLLIWFRRLLSDIKANRAGLPDLIQFWPAQRRYRMIEVKGPGDRLQDNQLRWLELCARHGMPVQVCYVEWADDAVTVKEPAI